MNGGEDDDRIAYLSPARIERRVQAMVDQRPLIVGCETTDARGLNAATLVRVSVDLEACRIGIDKMLSMWRPC